MTPQEIHERLVGRFGERVGPMAETKRDPFFTVTGDALVEICRFAKNDPDLALDALEDLTALDWPKRDAIELVLHLFSFRYRHAVALKVVLDRGAPSVPTLSHVWRAAEWFEREVLDLFGVTFEGHPDPRRIMLPDDWEGWPLRKDYTEHGGWHGIGNERENPLVELRRLDDKLRADAKAAEPPPAPPSAAPAPPPAAPAPPPAAPAPAAETPRAETPVAETSPPVPASPAETPPAAATNPPATEGEA